MTSLFTLEKEADAERLTTLLAESNTATVRQRAAEILGDLDIPDDEVVESLTTAAQDDDDAGVRAAAIDALDQREAVELLISAIVGEEVGGRRAEALIDALSSD